MSTYTINDLIKGVHSIAMNGLLFEEDIETLQRTVRLLEGLSAKLNISNDGTADGPSAQGEKPGTNISEHHREMFDAVRNASNIALFSCYVDGQPSSAIVALMPEQNGEGFVVSPLFVTVNDYMRITDHKGEAAEH